MEEREEIGFGLIPTVTGAGKTPGGRGRCARGRAMFGNGGELRCGVGEVRGEGRCRGDSCVREKKGWDFFFFFLNHLCKITILPLTLVNHNSYIKIPI